METIFVNYLKYQAAKKRSVETTADLTGRDGKSWNNIRLWGTLALVHLALVH